MYKVFCGWWKRQVSGYIFFIIRCELKEVCEVINMEFFCCFEVYDFLEDDVKRFFVVCIGINSVIEQDVVLDEFVCEFGFLFFVLE